MSNDRINGAGTMTAEQIIGSFAILSMCYMGFAVCLYIINERKK